MSEFPTNASQGLPYQIASSLPGRLRLRIPSLLKYSSDQNTLKGAIAALEGITSVRVNPWANSIIITFAEGKVSPAQLERELATAINKVAPWANVKKAVPKTTESKTATLSEMSGSKDETIPVNETSDKFLTYVTQQAEPYRQVEVLPLNSQQQQCQERADQIEKLQDRLAAFRPVAGIGSAWLRRWYIYSPETIDFYDASTSSCTLVSFPKTSGAEAQWQELAAKQMHEIANLEQCLADLQRLAVIGEARTNKYRKYL